MIPVLETERLIMRAPTLDDFEVEAAFFESERSSFVGGPTTRELSWRTFAAVLGHWPLRGYGPWALEEKSSGAYLGRVGLWFPEGWPEPEISWTLSGLAAQGKGYAREAALRARAYAYGILNWTTAISLIDPDNTRSIALAERVGARFDSEFEHERMGKMSVYRHPAPAELDGKGTSA